MKKDIIKYTTIWHYSFPLIVADYKDKSGGSNMEILYILVPSVAIPLAIALLFFFICVCRNNQKSSRPPAPRQPKPVRGQNVEMSMLSTAYKPKVEERSRSTWHWWTGWEYMMKALLTCTDTCKDVFIVEVLSLLDTRKKLDWNNVQTCMRLEKLRNSMSISDRMIQNDQFPNIIFIFFNLSSTSLIQFDTQC